MNISDITRQIQSYSFRYEPAELTIRQRPVEMEADWQPVWDELGLQRPSVAASERKNEAIQVAVQATQQKAQEGDQLGNIAKSKTTFGQIAFERYMQKAKRSAALCAAFPKRSHRYSGLSAGN